MRSYCSGVRSTTGSFLSLLSCQQFVLPHWPRLAWLYVDRNSRALISGNGLSDTTLSMEERKDGYLDDLLWRIKASMLYHQFHQKMKNIFDLAPSAEIGEASLSNVLDFDMKSSMRKLLLLLRDMRRYLTWSKADGIEETDFLCFQSSLMCTKLNEYIILTGNIAASNAPSKAMAQALVENLIAWVEENFSYQDMLGRKSVSPPVQPRRDVAKALLLSPPKPLHPCSIAHTRRLAFQVFQSRVMTLADWYAKYFESVHNEDDHAVGASSNEAAFLFAVYELVHCGFVRKLTTDRTKEDVYEKVAIVWASGR